MTQKKFFKPISGHLRCLFAILRPRQTVIPLGKDANFLWRLQTFVDVKRMFHRDHLVFISMNDKDVFDPSDLLKEVKSREILIKAIVKFRKSPMCFFFSRSSR